MTTLLVAAGLGFLLSSPLASAQSLAGVSIGDTEAKVMKALPGATAQEGANLHVVFTPKTTVWVCKSAAFLIRDTVGSAPTDYLSLVERETGSRGKPAVASGVSKVGSVRQGWMRSEWSGRNQAVSVEFRHTGHKHVVTSSLTGDSPC